MSWALYLHEDQDMAELIDCTLSATMVDVETVVVNSIAEAHDALDERGFRGLRLIVTSVSPPLDRDCARSIDRNLATVAEFLGGVRRGTKSPPVVAVVSTNDGARLSEIMKLGNVISVSSDSVAAFLPGIVRQLLSPSPESASPATSRRVDVDITLSMEGKCTWVLKGCRTHPLDDSGSILVDGERLEKLLRAREDSADSARYSAALLGRIGCDLYECLMAHSLKTEELERKFRRQLSQDSRIEEARFRFLVDNETSLLLVEALAKPKGPKPGDPFVHWMLETPIYRKFRGAAEGYALYKDVKSRSSEIPCLVIQGRANSFSVGGEIARGFDAIPGAETEASWLEGYFGENLARFQLKAPRILRPQDFAAGEFAAAVRRTLADEGPWPLVHYVGHSVVTNKGKGHVVLGPGEDELIGAQELSTLTLAARTQMLFLNSCQSAGGSFISQLVQLGLPAVLGYNWEVSDRIASDFAASFYRNLFEQGLSKRFIEYAFMRAKRELYERGNREVPAQGYRATHWTAPLLFMQMREFQADHTSPIPAARRPTEAPCHSHS